MQTEKATNAADLPHEYRADLMPGEGCRICGREYKHGLHATTSAVEKAHEHAGVGRLQTEKGT